MADTFSESFNHGLGALNHTWGNVDTSIAGQVTVSGSSSGIMEHPSGAAAGHGYGEYSFTLSMSGDAQGPAALLWPGNDKWPGPEFDVAEFIDGHVYGTVHSAGHDGGDQYECVTYDGINASDKHTYTLDWEPGKITFGVDGHTYGSVGDNVGADFAHGGVNEVIGVNNMDSDTSITLYEVSYTPSDHLWA